MSSTYHNRLFNSDIFPDSLPAPDELSKTDSFRPTSEFVLCRDLNGEPTAIYGELEWKLKPFSLSEGENSSIIFKALILEGLESESMAIIEEVKQILFYLLYYTSSGRAGFLSLSTIMGYWMALRRAALFCLAQDNNGFTGVLSIKALLENRVYHQKFVSSHAGKKFNKVWPALLKHLRVNGKQLLGLSLSKSPKMDEKAGHTDQTPVIPVRLYLEYLDGFTREIERLHSVRYKLENFILEFQEPLYATSIQFQKKSLSKDLHKHLKPTMQEALKAHKLTRLGDEYGIKSRQTLQGALRRMQQSMRFAIHYFTAMRNAELRRASSNPIKENSIKKRHSTKNVKNVPVEFKVIQICSTTTKFTGFKQESAWYASDEVVKAVEILQSIAKGLVFLKGVEFESCPLFVNPAIITRKDAVIYSSFDKDSDPKWFKNLIINEQDFAELQASDTKIDFNQKPEYFVGQPWPLRSHQLRRSLAFYGTNSGFISLPTVKRQFKHLSLAMARYYSRNFEQIKTIFGYYDEETKTYKLPEDHVIFDIQMAIPINQAEMLIADTLDSNDVLFGKTGGYIERQKDKLNENEIDIRLIKEDTIKRVVEGEISYRKTLLGGCTKVDGCDCSLLGEFTECFHSSCSVIKESLIMEQIKLINNEMKKYPIDSGEYRILKAEHDSAENYVKLQKLREKV